MSKLREICRIKTDLEESEIVQLEAVEQQLPLIAALTDADVFIDCFLDAETAVVVAQARPLLSGSVYAGDAVGKQALATREPAVFHAWSIGMPVCDLKGITQENKAVRQNAAPIFGRGNRVIAVLIREKDISSELQQGRKYEQLARSHEDENPIVPVSRGQSAIDIQEVHHRVKNNLQLVASILDLQARQSDDPRVQGILRENLGRVLSIASIHDILTKNMDRTMLISSEILLERLKSNLLMLVPVNKSVHLMVSGDEVFLCPDTATSVALVTTELVTNALQHAFEDRDEGTVDISLCKGNLYHTVTVSDNGNGFVSPPPGSGSLGLNIVRATVCEKLKGRFRISSDSSGTKACFDFKNELNDGSAQ